MKKQPVKKQPLNEEFKRMQKLAGIQLNEIKFGSVSKGDEYFATEDFGIFKKGDKVYVDAANSFGAEVVLKLRNEKNESDSIKGDLEDDVEVFD